MGIKDFVVAKLKRVNERSYNKRIKQNKQKSYEYAKKRSKRAKKTGEKFNFYVAMHVDLNKRNEKTKRRKEDIDDDLELLR